MSSFKFLGPFKDAPAFCPPALGSVYVNDAEDPASFVEHLSVWIYPMFACDSVGTWGIGAKADEVSLSPLLNHITSGLPDVTITRHWWSPDPLVKAVFATFPVGVPVSSLLASVLQMHVTKPSSHLWKLSSTFWRWEYVLLRNGVFLKERFASSLLNSMMYLYQYRFMCVHFIFWVITQYHTIHSVLQNIQLHHWELFSCCFNMSHLLSFADYIAFWN